MPMRYLVRKEYAICPWLGSTTVFIPKISPGANFFRLGLPYSWKWIYRFCVVLLCIWGQFSKYKPPGGLYLEGRFNGGFFASPVWGPTFGGAYFRNFMGIFPGLSYNKASKMFLNSLRKNETEAQVEFTLKIIERITVGRMVAFRCD